MVRTCHTPRPPVKNHPSGHLGGCATPSSAEEMLDGQHQGVDIPAHARTAHKALLLTRPSCLPDDPIGQGTELNCHDHVCYFYQDAYRTNADFHHDAQHVSSGHCNLIRQTLELRLPNRVMIGGTHDTRTPELFSQAYYFSPRRSLLCHRFWAIYFIFLSSPVFVTP